jgi:hypothetical protein
MELLRKLLLLLMQWLATLAQAELKVWFQLQRQAMQLQTSS